MTEKYFHIGHRARTAPQLTPFVWLSVRLFIVVWVRGRFSDHHKVGFLTISRTVFRLYEGGLPAISGLKTVPVALRYFDIKPVRCGEAAPFPFQQPRRVQFIKRPLDGGAAFIQYFCYLRDGIDNINLPSSSSHLFFWERVERSNSSDTAAWRSVKSPFSAGNGDTAVRRQPRVCLI